MQYPFYSVFSWFFLVILRPFLHQKVSANCKKRVTELRTTLLEVYLVLEEDGTEVDDEEYFQVDRCRNIIITTLSCESGFWTIEKWKNIFHFSREVQSEIRRLEIEIEKWKWNENDWKSRSRSESEMKKLWDREMKFLENLKRTDFEFWRYLFWVLHPPQIVKFLMNFGVKFHSFSREKGWNFFLLLSFREMKVK